MGNRGLTRLVNVLFGTRYTDLNYGYSAFWRPALDAITIDCEGFEVETLICIRVARADLVVREVASFEHRRLHGASKLHAVRDGLRVLRTILRERLRRQGEVTVTMTGDPAPPTSRRESDRVFAWVSSVLGLTSQDVGGDRQQRRHRRSLEAWDRRAVAPNHRRGHPAVEIELRQRPALLHDVEVGLGHKCPQLAGPVVARLRDAPRQPTGQPGHQRHRVAERAPVIVQAEAVSLYRKPAVRAEQSQVTAGPKDAPRLGQCGRFTRDVLQTPR